MKLESDARFEEKLTCRLENDLSNLANYELKIYRVFMCHDNQEWWKIWRGIDSSVQNFVMRNLKNFGPSSRKSKKFAF